MPCASLTRARHGKPGAGVRPLPLLSAACPDGLRGPSAKDSENVVEGYELICIPIEDPHLHLSQLTAECVDMLLYMCASILPNIKPNDLGGATKRDVRLAGRKQYEVRLARARQRFDEIAEEVSDLPQIAVLTGIRCLFAPRRLASSYGAWASSSTIDLQITRGSSRRLSRHLLLSHVELLSRRHRRLRSRGLWWMAKLGLRVLREDKKEEPDAKRAKLGQKEKEDTEKEELGTKKVRLALPKLNLPCLPSQSHETAALRRRREKAEADGADEPNPVDID